MGNTPKVQTITGEIFNIKYRNVDGWAVFSVTGQAMAFTGILAEMIDVGSEVTCTGIVENGKFGKQMKCQTIVPSAPDVSTETGVMKLLQRLPGIGPKKAMQAIETHGHEHAWNLAQNNPEDIGVPPALADEAKNIAKQLLASYEATVYLLGIGLTDHQAAIIYRNYKDDAIRIVSQDPYQLTEIDGFGFITVDKIALKAGMSPGNPSRIAACVLYVLEDSALNGGHIWHSGWKLTETVLEILTQTAMKAEVSLTGLPDTETVRQRIKLLQADKKIIINKGKVFNCELLQAEETILEFAERTIN